MAGAVVNCGSEIHDGAIINTCASVDHDCMIGDFCHISVGVHIAGTVNIGNEVFVCAGATVINNLNICGECVIGAGAVVIKNIESVGTYLGVPAELKKSL
jgi:UDP-3-O-[3-hydroxymyristoyl] glucosamine N-acyltransferase